MADLVKQDGEGVQPAELHQVQPDHVQHPTVWLRLKISQLLITSVILTIHYIKKEIKEQCF